MKMRTEGMSTEHRKWAFSNRDGPGELASSMRITAEI
jgi:hypothetical protein